MNESISTLATLGACGLPGKSKIEAAPGLGQAAGKMALTFDFAYGGGLEKGGTGILSTDGRKLAEVRIDWTQPMGFSADEIADVGVNVATPVAEGIGEGHGTRFTGKIEKVTVGVK